MPGEVLQSNPQQVETYADIQVRGREVSRGGISQIETKDNFLAKNPVSVHQGQSEDWDGGTKENLVTDGQVTRGHTCHAQKLGIYFEGFSLQRDHSGCSIENGLENKTGGKQTNQEMLVIILGRGGGGLAQAVVVETEICQQIPEMKGTMVRHEWK